MGNTIKPAKKLKRGTVVYGFANGFFGRDSYEDKIVIEKGRYGEVQWFILAEVEDPTKLWLAKTSDERFDLLLANTVKPKDDEE